MSKNELLRNANAAAGSALPFDNISARQHARLRGLLKDIETALAIAGRDHPVVKGIAELLEPAREMAHYDPTGLWQPLGEAWWRRAGEMLGGEPEASPVCGGAAQRGEDDGERARCRV